MIDSHFLKDVLPKKNCLKGKTILVTGAGRGIGKQAALSFAEFGANVILVGRTMNNLEAVYDEIEEAGHPKPAIFPINFEGALERDFDLMAEAVATEFKSLDGLLHNAGEMGTRTPMGKYPVSDWNKLLQVNITAPFLTTKALLPILQKAPSASILFTGSSVGIKGRAYWGAYAISKAACENMMEVLADELENPGTVRVNSINPGATRTDMRALAYPAEDPASILSPSEIMNRYVYLMSDESKDVRGQQFSAQPK